VLAVDIGDEGDDARAGLAVPIGSHADHDLVFAVAVRPPRRPTKWENGSRKRTRDRP
jgi:hypothetical protein